MAKISGDRLKEMEAEMFRFEEEILSTKQAEEEDGGNTEERKDVSNGPMAEHPNLPPGVHLGPRPENTPPRLVIHSNTYAQAQAVINENMRQHNFEMRPPPPPPQALTRPDHQQHEAHSMRNQNPSPYFIPPQLRNRPMYPMPPRPYYPPNMHAPNPMMGSMGPPRPMPYMMGPMMPNYPRAMPSHPAYQPNESAKAEEDAGDSEKVEKKVNTAEISHAKVVYSAPPMKRKEVEVTGQSDNKVKDKENGTKKIKLDVNDKKKVKKSKTETITTDAKKKNATDPSKTAVPTQPNKPTLSQSKPPPVPSTSTTTMTPATEVAKTDVNLSVIELPKSNMEPPKQGSKKEKEKERKEKKNKFVRMAASAVWEDPSLGEWDQDDFRMFCGDLGNEVGDDTLARAFNKYGSFQKARVIRDKRTNKTKGFGFVSFRDPNDFVRAMREMNGKYVGNRPIKLRKSVWQERQIDNVKKKEREKKKLGFK